MILATVGFFEWLVRASWQAAVLVGMVLLLQWLLGRRLSARWRAALWGIVLVRLVMPALPASRVSVFNLVNAIGRGERGAMAETSPVALEPLPKGDTAAESGPLVGTEMGVVDRIETDPVGVALCEQVPSRAEQGERERPSQNPLSDATGGLSAEGTGRQAARGTQHGSIVWVPLAACPPVFFPRQTNTGSKLPVAHKQQQSGSETASKSFAAAPATTAGVKDELSAGIPWKGVLAIVWGGVAALLLARVAVASIRLWRSVRGLDAIADERMVDLFEACRREMGVRRGVVLLDAPWLSSPALVGAIRPRLLLPMHVLVNFSRAELRMMFLHELAHVRRNDVAVNWLCTLVGIMHWFNPALWLAFARMKSDREMACDELVLARSGEEGRRVYGYTILKLLQTLSRSAGVPGMVGILEGMHCMRRRIVMIANFGTRRPWPVLVALAGLALAAVTLTDAVAQQRDEPAAAASPTAGGAVVPVAGPVALPGVAPGVPGPVPVADVAQQKDEPTVAVSPTGGVPAVMPTRPVVPPGVATGMPGAVPVGGRPSAVTAPEPRSYATRGGRFAGGAGRTGMGGMGGVPAMPQPVIRTTIPSPDPAVEKALQKNMPDVVFRDAPLNDLMDALRDQTGLNIKVDWRALAEVGIAADAPMQLRLKNVPAGEVLRQILSEAGSDTLGYRIEGNIVVVTTRDVLDRELTLKAYQVGSLVEGGDVQEQAMRMQELLTLIRDTVSPQSWADNGGASTMRGYGTTIIVATTQSNHNAIAQVLSMLSQGKKR